MNEKRIRSGGVLFYILLVIYSMGAIVFFRESSISKLWSLFFWALVLAPLLETILYQCAIQELSHFIGVPRWLSISISWGLFLLSHFGGVIRTLIPGFIGGGVLAIFYAEMRVHGFGKSKSIVATFILHSAYNLSVLLIFGDVVEFN